MGIQNSIRRAGAVVATALFALALTAPGAQAQTNCNLTISSGMTVGVTISAGTYTATADNAVLNVNQLDTALENGDVTLQTVTGTSCSGDGTLTVSNAIDVTSGTYTLNLTTAPSLGSITLDANMTVLGTVNFESPTSVGASVTVTAPTANFDSYLNGLGGPFSLTVTGAASFDGPVGSITALASLSVSGTTTFDTSPIPNVTTTGTQTYSGAVTLAAAATLTSTGGDGITFDSAVDGGAGLITDTTGATSFDAAVGATTPLASVSIDSGPATLGGNVTTAAGQGYGGAVTLSADVTTKSTSGTLIHFAATVDGGHSLTTNTTGETFLGGTVGGTMALTGLDVESGSAVLNGDVTTSAGQTYAGPVTLDQAETTLHDTGNSEIAFDSTVDGASALTVNTGGQTVFDGAVGGTSALASLTADGASTIDANIKTSGGQSYEGAVTLGGDVTATSTGGDAITFVSTIGGAHNLSVSTAGTTTFEGSVGSPTLGVLDVESGPTTLDAAVVTTGGETYQAVTLGADVALEDIGAGAITFDSTIDGAHSLNVDTTGHTVFDGAVGGTTPLTSVNVMGGQAVFDGGNVTTSGGQNYVTVGLDQNATLSMGGNGAISNGINGSGTGLTKKGAGTLTLGFNGLNDYSGGTTIDGGLIEFVNGGDFADGPITINGGGLEWSSGNTADVSSGPIAIGAGGATFDTNGNNVTFAEGLTGTGPLTKTGAGTLTLAGVTTDSAATDVEGGSLDVTGTLPGRVTVQSSGTLACTGGGTLSGGVTNDGGTVSAVPDVPTGVSASAGSGSATVSFTPGAANCLPLGTYTVTASPGGAHASGSGSPITVSGLTNGESYTFTVTETNPIGSSAASSASNAVTPGGSGGSGTAPSLSNLKQSHSKWREAKKGKAKKPPVGTAFSFTLKEKAEIRFAFSGQLPGRKVGGRCVAQTKKNAHKPSCKRTVNKGTLTVAGKAGQNTVAFDGKQPKLPPGRYTVTVVASASGKTSSPAKLSFTITPN